MKTRVLNIVSFILILFVLTGTGVLSFTQTVKDKVKKENINGEEQKTSSPETETISVRNFVPFGNIHFEITGPTAFIFTVGSITEQVSYVLKTTNRPFNSYLELLFTYFIVKQAP